MKREAPVVRLINHNKSCNLENVSAAERAGHAMVENLITEQPGTALFEIQMCKLATMKGQAVRSMSCLHLVAKVQVEPISL